MSAAAERRRSDAVGAGEEAAGLVRVDAGARERAAVLLGPAAPEPGSPTSAWIAALAALLEAHGDAQAHGAQERHRERLAAIERRTAGRLAALAGVERATGRLAEHSAPYDILRAAPAELVQLADLQRVVLGTVARSVLTVEEVAVRDDPAAGVTLLASLRGAEVRLGHPLVETELLRRRRSVVVDAAQEPDRVHPHLGSVMRWRDFVAAPVATGASVVAILYADAGPAARVADDASEVVGRFAAEVARTYETARLRRAIRLERHETRRFSAGLEQRSRALLDSAHQIELAEPSDAAVERRGPAAGTSSTLFAGVLTPRELEVLELMSTGHTNRAIADRLVLAPATVKSHVYRILTKLNVANRAHAVALYLTPRDGADG